MFLAIFVIFPCYTNILSNLNISTSKITSQVTSDGPPVISVIKDGNIHK